jgi:hypothetical protein
MQPSEKNEEGLDPSKIDFPLDSVTFGRMRRFYPRALSGAQLDHARAAEIDLIAAHCFELSLAERAFAKAAGHPDPHPVADRREDIATVNAAYKLYGLSSGMQETKQLVRTIETAAAKQAARAR